MKKSELQQKRVAELREMASEMGLTGTSKLRKSDLIAVIMNASRRRSRTKPGGQGKKSAGSRQVVKKSAGSGRTAKSAPKRTPKKEAVAKTSSSKKTAQKRSKATSTKASATRRASSRKKAAESERERSTLSPRTSRAFAAFRERGEQRVRASKYYLAAHETPELDSDFQFPVTYGENRIALMVRDPYWLFSYWEFAPDLEADLTERLGADVVAKSRLILRVYDVTDNDPQHADGWHDIEIATGARNWYINVMRVEREYCVDIGLLTPDGVFILIARSNRVSLPPVGPSDVVDEEWVVVEALDGMYRESGPGGPTSGSGGWGSGGLRD